MYFRNSIQFPLSASAVTRESNEGKAVLPFIQPAEVPRQSANFPETFCFAGPVIYGQFIDCTTTHCKSWWASFHALYISFSQRVFWYIFPRKTTIAKQLQTRTLPWTLQWMSSTTQQMSSFLLFHAFFHKTYYFWMYRWIMYSGKKLSRLWCFQGVDWVWSKPELEHLTCV